MVSVGGVGTSTHPSSSFDGGFHVGISVPPSDPRCTRYSVSRHGGGCPLSGPGRGGRGQGRTVDTRKPRLTWVAIRFQSHLRTSSVSCLRYDASPPGTRRSPVPFGLVSTVWTAGRRGVVLDLVPAAMYRQTMPVQVQGSHQRPRVHTIDPAVVELRTGPET